MYSTDCKLNYCKGPKPRTTTSAWNYDESPQSVKHEQPAVLVLCHITNTNIYYLHNALTDGLIDGWYDFSTLGPEEHLQQLETPFKADIQGEVG